ncbi:ankyrin repeat and LEM domain-containing protein 2 homolog [Phymastichus coffea]|uniref:ankyrin repeat and LEM domain-containing protein 2 homolog n=1 Tax=Phymastichus coffea TaxID=108790 RepID=UPI00273B9872|nr:ankyrin repeat and LEM domain-containing protein 2 homolog [Phymastichus coffea]XP_058788717.1 ankyrin repeat and LEM domain-containing protein 2 homolog [Phymastichus coffea]
METRQPTVYHAVYLPLEETLVEAEDSKVHIYCDKNEALKIIKKHKKSRLKTFKNIEEAREFARNGLESVLPNPLANAVPTIVLTEEKNRFKVPKPQNLTKLRKAIEQDNIEFVKTTVWDNPRYLVSGGDTPAILHEGCRYNALHVAVKVTQNPAMCEFILNTVGNPEFLSLYYGDADKKTYVNRASILQDLYLNTPDKGLNETPLHFATKFGLKECVRTLLSYPQCLRSPLNKYQQTPADIICSRKSIDDKELINEIRSLLEEQYYVPVLRAEDNSLQPTIGEPFSPVSPPRININPINPKIEVRAFAGPMTKSQALEFRKKWKTPPRLFGTPNKKTPFSNETNGLRSPSLHLSLRLQDSDKGLERVGRDLALEHHVSWKEYWPFLKDFADLRCNDGLSKLEEFLKTKYIKKTPSFEHEQNSSTPDDEQPKSKLELNNLCNQLNSLLLESQNVMDEDCDDNCHFVTPPSSPSHGISNDESSDEEEMDLADDNLKEELFLEGKLPTKIDFAVFTAIPTEIDLSKYPYIYRWRHEMSLASKNHIYERTIKHIPFKRKLFSSET